MPKQYTVEEAMAYFDDKGLDWSPEVEAELRRQGKIVGPARPPLGKAPARDIDPRFANPDAIPVNPIGGQGKYNRDSLAAQFFEGLGRTALPWADLPPTAGDADTIGKKIVRGIGQGAGFLPTFGAIGGAVAPVGRAVGAGVQATQYAPLAPVAANTVTGALGLGAYGAMAPGTPMERIENFASGANAGAGFGAAGGLPLVGKALSHPFWKYPANAALMAGVEAAHGGDPIQGAAMGATLPLLHRGGPKAEPAPERLAKTPAEMEVPKDAQRFRERRAFDLKEVEAAMKEPIPGNRADEVATELLNTNSIDGMIESLKKKPVLHKPSGERIKELTAEVSRERKYADNFDGRAESKTSEEAKLRAERELVPKELADWIDVEAGRVEADKKLPTDQKKYKSPLDNIQAGKAQAYDMRRMLQGQGGGKVGWENLMDKHVLRVNERAQQVTMRVRDLMNAEVGKEFEGIKENSPEDLALKKAMASRPTQKTTWQELTADEFWASETGREISESLPSDASRAVVRERLERLRPMTEKMWKQLNDLSRAFGGDPVGHVEAYIREVEAKPKALDFREKWKREWNRASPGARPPSGDGKLWNPAELARRGTDTPKDPSAMRAMDDYVRHFSESAGHQIALANNMAVAKYLERKGFNNAATILRNYSQSVYNKKPYGINASVSERLNSGGVGGIYGAVSRWHLQRFNEAVFTANIGWNLVVQPSSTALAAGHGMGPGIKALETMIDPRFRKMVDGLYSMQMKSRKHGGMVTQGESGDVVAGTSLVPESKGQAVKRNLQKPSSWMEQETGYYAAATAWHQGRAMELKGRELADFMSDRIAKTQSMYDRYNRPEELNSQEIRAHVPAQSFLYEMKNNAAEQMGNKLGTYQQYQGGKQKTGYAVRAAAWMALFGAVAKQFANRDLFGPESFIPYNSQLTGGGIAKGVLYPASVLADLTKIPKDLAKGRYGSAFSRIARHYIIAGTQLARVAQTIEARNEDVAKFTIEDDEVLKSLLVGPYATGSGREYYEEYEGFLPDWWPKEWTPESLQKTPAEQEIPAAANSNRRRGRPSGGPTRRR